MDPRVPQIFSLALLLLLGTQWKSFPLDWRSAVALVLVVTFLQMLLLPRRSLLSGFISVLSVLLLLRCRAWPWYALAGGLVVFSKRWVGTASGHLFNPANFAIVCLLLLFPSYCWVSFGQWGFEHWLLGLMVALGGAVTSKARTLSVSLGFLGSYGLLLFLRVHYLEQAGGVWVQQMQSGSLLVFSFFMISDPRTVPVRLWARGLFVAVVALLAFIFRFNYDEPNGLFYALFLMAPLTPFIDNLTKSKRYDWQPVNTTTTYFGGFQNFSRQWLLRVLRR